MSDSFRLHSLAAVRKPRSDAGRKRDLTVTVVHPEVWARALDCADGDVTRIVVESSTSVTVLNKSRKDRL